MPASASQVEFRRWARGCALLLALCAGLPSCAAPAGPRDTSSWLEARGADLMDVFGLRLSAGVGLGVWVRATEAVQLGFMARGPAERDLVAASAMQGADSFRVRSVPVLVIGTIGRYGGVWTETSREVLLPGYSNRDELRSPITREIIAGVVSETGQEDDWRGSLGVGAHLVLFGAEFEVRPWQVVDFLAGLILGYDPSGDDVPVEDFASSPSPSSAS